MKTIIGIDYGTLSARAILTDAETGATLRECSYVYPHGILPGDLAFPEDYEVALDTLLSEIAIPPYNSTIVSIGVDATSLTLVLTDSQGRILGTLPQWKENEQAQIKLWKRHAAQSQADEALALAQQTHQPFLGRTGGTISGEWMLPKLMETFDKAPDVWAHADLAFDLCDFLTYRLTGSVTRSKGSMCFKAMWADDFGFPSNEYFNALRPGLAEKYRSLLRGNILAPGTIAGALRPELCKKYHLPQGVLVAAGILDGHTSAAALGALNDGDASLVIGTSNVLAIQTSVLSNIDGICGIAKDSFVPGLYGIDSGQACTGDMLNWFIHHMVPADYTAEANARGMNIHTYLCSLIQQPWNHQITAVDWFNGSRNVPCNLTLPGGWVGLTLNSRPEDLYLALLQSIVCGTKEILDQCASYGVKVRRVTATGGIAQKNPLLMQLYADILQQEISVGQFTQGPALGTAIYASAAAGLYSNVGEAARHIGIKQYTSYIPNPLYADQHKMLYKKNHRLRCCLAEYANGIV